MLKIIIIMMGMMGAIVGMEGRGEARDAWTTTDTALQIVVTGLTVADWAQTSYMSRNPEQYEEMMPLTRAIIGRHPSEGRVNALIGSCVVLNAVIAYNLARPYRTYWQGFWIGVEGFAVARNYRMGIRLSF